MKKKIALLIISFFCFIGITIAVAWAWFLNNELVEPDVSGYSASAYFAGGDGSEEHPYEIATPKHLYNLAWLQYLGTFNNPGTGNVRNDSATTLTQYHFVLNNDINMDGWVLPPIGTSLRPFIGFFDGNGYVVSNLTTSNNFSEYGNRHPSSISSVSDVDVVGFFGVIGPISGMENSTKTVSDKENMFVNTYLQDTVVKSNVSNPLVGIAVGYVNGEVSDIGVIDSSLNFANNSGVSPYSTNISDYGVAGYATEDYVTQKVKSSTLIYNPTYNYAKYTYKGQGDATGWGGSIDMYSLWSRLNQYATGSGTTGFNYVISETRVIKSTGTTTKDQVTGTRYYTNSYTAGSYAKKIIVDSDDLASGIYLFDRYNNRNGNNDWNYLTALYKSVTLIYVSDETVEGYKISDGADNYLRLVDGSSYGNCYLDNTSDETSATVWVYLDNKLYTYSEYDGYTYYLTGEDELEVIVSEYGNDAADWTYDDSNGSFYEEYNGTKYYLYFDEEWLLQVPDNYYYITDGNGNYLSVNGTTLVNYTSQVDATQWYFSQPGDNPSGYILVYTNYNWYYLVRNGSTLELSTDYSNGEWNNNGGGIVYNNNVVRFDGSDWIYGTATAQTTFYISNGTNYLTATGNSTSASITNSTSISTASKWTFSNPGTRPSGTISTVISGVTYYLNIPTNGNSNTITLSLSKTSSSSFSNNGTNLYFNSGNRSYQLRYNSGWVGRRNNSTTLQSSSGYIMTLTNAGIYNSIVFASENASFISLDRTEDEINIITREIVDEPSEIGYIPLNVDENNYVKDTNTGYIIGGGHETTAAYKGDIRVSQYAISNIGNGYSTNGYFKNILTVNGSGSSFNIQTILAYSSLSNYQSGIASTDLSANYAKLMDSQASFLSNALTGKSYVYGLHFMQTAMSKDKLIVAPKVTINGEDYYNYQMPEDSINFRLADKGYINFFAGDFFSGNNGNKSFCSIYHIIRNNNNEILEMKHIIEVYKKDNNSDYIYKYEGGTYSSPLSSGYSMVFNSQWIENPGISVSSNLYYFEIPANEGEYAIGASSTVGGYIFYLDIGANAQQIERTKITQKSVNTLDTFAYVTGIAIISSKADVLADTDKLDPKNSAVVSIAQGTTGDVTLSRSGDTITTNKNLGSSYVGLGVTLQNSSTSTTINATPVSSNGGITTYYLDYIDYNTANEEVWYTHIVKVGNAAATYTLECSNEEPENEWALFDDQGNTVNITSISINATGNTKLYDYWYMYGSEETVTEVITIDSVTATSNLTNLIDNEYVVSGNSVSFTTTEAFTVHIVTKSGSYVLKINGTAKNANSTEQVSAS